MIKKFQNACEDIAGKPFEGSFECYILAGPLIFILGAFGGYLLQSLFFLLSGNWIQIPWIALISLPVCTGIYYIAIVLWGYAFRISS